MPGTPRWVEAARTRLHMQREEELRKLKRADGMREMEQLALKDAIAIGDDDDDDTAFDLLAELSTARGEPAGRSGRASGKAHAPSQSEPEASQARCTPWHV